MVSLRLLQEASALAGPAPSPVRHTKPFLDFMEAADVAAEQALQAAQQRSPLCREAKLAAFKACFLFGAWALKSETSTAAVLRSVK